MADNTRLNVGVDGDVIATDDISGVKHQQVKVEWGIDGTATPVSAANPLPVTSVVTGTVAVTQSGTWDEVGINDSGNSITVDGTVSLTDINAGEYETVAASQTAQVLGATGGTGDWISGLLVIPATTSPGNVLLLDNATSITVFTGGATSVSNLVPFFIPLGMKSVSGAWKVTTGANVSVIGIGNFT